MMTAIPRYKLNAPPRPAKNPSSYNNSEVVGRKNLDIFNSGLDIFVEFYLNLENAILTYLRTYQNFLDLT